MSGWSLATIGDYARSDNAVAAYPFTVFVAAQSDDIGTDTDFLFQMSQAAATGQYWSIRHAVSSTFLQFDSVQAGTIRTAIVTNANTNGVPFAVVAIATSATDRKIIVNGDLVNAGVNTTSSTPASVDRLSFGRKDDAAPGSQWEGPIFAAALWTAALTDAEAVALCSGVWPAKIRPAALRNFWPNWASQDGGATIRDWCGRSHLTLNAGLLDGDSIRRLGPPRPFMGRMAQGTRAQARVI